MHLIETLKCDHCDYQTEKVRSTYLYTVTYKGEIDLEHPRESEILRQATGLEWHAARSQGMLRMKYFCLCYSCTATFYLDIDRYKKECLDCHSQDVRTFTGAIEELCPSCAEGRLKLNTIGEL